MPEKQNAVEMIADAYRRARNIDQLVELLRPVIADMARYSSAEVMTSMIGALREPIAEGDKGALASAVALAGGLNEWPEWLVQETVKYGSAKLLSSDEDTSMGRHSRPSTRNEDIVTAVETVAIYNLIRTANRKFGRRGSGGAREITAGLVNCSVDSVRTRIAAVKKIGSLKDIVEGYVNCGRKSREAPSELQQPPESGLDVPPFSCSEAAQPSTNWQGSLEPKHQPSRDAVVRAGGVGVHPDHVELDDAGGH